jgi:exoribonuclease R
MLPRMLSEHLCSLNPGVDRLAYSVMFRMDLSTGDLVEDFQPVIKRSVIRSCAKWNYDFVQRLLTEDIPLDEIPEEMRPLDG